MYERLKGYDASENRMDIYPDDKYFYPDTSMKISYDKSFIESEELSYAVGASLCGHIYSIVQIDVKNNVMKLERDIGGLTKQLLAQIDCQWIIIKRD